MPEHVEGWVVRIRTALLACESRRVAPAAGDARTRVELAPPAAARRRAFHGGAGALLARAPSTDVWEAAALRGGCRSGARGGHLFVKGEHRRRREYGGRGGAY